MGDAPSVIVAGSRDRKTSAAFLTRQRQPQREIQALTPLSETEARDRLQQTADQLFMIIGMGRSGTSLLQAMLSSHPEVMIPNETQFYTVIARKREHRGDLSDPDRYRRAVDYVLMTRQVEQMEVDGDTVRALSGAGAPSWDTIFLALLTAYALKHGAGRVGEKSPGHLLHVGHLKDALPRVRFIQMVRDPRGTINSLRRAPFGTRSIMMGVASWRRSYDLQTQWHAALGDQRSHFVTYESLVRDPQSTLERLCAFLDLAFDPQMLDHHERSVAGFGSWQHGHMQNTLKPVFTSSIEKWRDQMHPAQIAMIETELATQMEDLGYAPSRPEVRCLGLWKTGSRLVGQGQRLFNQTRRRLAGP